VLDSLGDSLSRKSPVVWSKILGVGARSRGTLKALLEARMSTRSLVFRLCR
jgi:hypothetical protein